jgi:hypothetical protein
MHPGMPQGVLDQAAMMLWVYKVELFLRSDMLASHRCTNILSILEHTSLKAQHSPHCQGPLCNEEQQSSGAQPQHHKQELFVPWRPETLEGQYLSAGQQQAHVSCCCLFGFGPSAGQLPATN